MTAQALYLKYRPLIFDDVVGQEPITRTLRNALRLGKLRHAYLLTGPRGTGKTTTARLLAKAVNCHAPLEERPCNDCSICVAINEGRLLDLIEIDAASNRGIDEIRDIREKVGFRPNEGRFKVYVLDEAHMLTEPAFNALLKTLEEPPPHIIFVLVTTDPHKIPATITSRCQRFDFKRIALQAIMDRLAYIAEQEGVTVEPAALELIARQGTGAMRDAISLLDQLTSYGDESQEHSFGIMLDQVQMVLGTVASEAAGELVACVADGDVAGGLDLINRTVGDGADPRQFAREVVEFLRGLLLVEQGAGTRLLNATAEQAAEIEDLAGRMQMGRLLRAIHLFNEAATDLRRGLQTIPQLSLEMALVECTLAPQATEVTATPAVQPLPKPQPKPEARRVAEQPAPAPTPTPGPAAEAKAPTLTEPAPQPSPTGGLSPTSGALTLQQVVQAWPQVLEAVRQRNPTTQAALNTGCEPVEVNGDEVVVIFPFPFLKDKLGDHQRRTEIRDVLSEVLGANCRLKLVLASEYMPKQKANPAPNPAPAPAAQASEPAAGDPIPDELSRWAQEHGGQVKLVQPG